MKDPHRCENSSICAGSFYIIGLGEELNELLQHFGDCLHGLDGYKFINLRPKPITANVPPRIPDQ